jgi:hypothetical protein
MAKLEQTAFAVPAPVGCTQPLFLHFALTLCENASYVCATPHGISVQRYDEEGVPQNAVVAPSMLFVFEFARQEHSC